MIKNQEIAARIYYYSYVSPGKYSISQIDKKFLEEILMEYIVLLKVKNWLRGVI